MTYAVVSKKAKIEPTDGASMTQFSVTVLVRSHSVNWLRVGFVIGIESKFLEYRFENNHPTIVQHFFFNQCK